MNALRALAMVVALGFGVFGSAYAYSINDTAKITRVCTVTESSKTGTGSV